MKFKSKVSVSQSMRDTMSVTNQYHQLISKVENYTILLSICSLVFSKSKKQNFEHIEHDRQVQFNLTQNSQCLTQIGIINCFQTRTTVSTNFCHLTIKKTTWWSILGKSSQIKHKIGTQSKKITNTFCHSLSSSKDLHLMVKIIYFPES